MRDGDATFGQKQLNIPEAEAEQVVEPDGMAQPGTGGGNGDRVTASCHQSRLSPGPRTGPGRVTVTMQALELHDVYQTKVTACDKQIEDILKRLRPTAAAPANKLLPTRQRARQPNAPAFDARRALHAILGVDLTPIDGLGPSLALKLVGECGTSLAAWPTAKHFTSWLEPAPHNKISGGKVLSSRTRRTGNRAASLLRLAAGTVGRTDTALGAFYRRLSARIGKAKAITATAGSPQRRTRPSHGGCTIPQALARVA